MQQYRVTGMQCAACSARVEKAVSAIAGVESCAVNLLTNSMGVQGDVPPEAVIAAVEAAGYGASLRGAEPQKNSVSADDFFKDTETPRRIRRLIVSVVLLLILMYCAMGHRMWGWPLPALFTGNPLAQALLQMLLSTAVLAVNRSYYTGGFRALLRRAPNMDTLVATGSGISYFWSICVLFAMTAADDPNALMQQLYFESAAMIPALITVGKTLEARAKGRTTDALRGLMSLAPKTAVILENGVEREIPAEQIRPGMTFVVRPGGGIPADGTVTDGSAAADESALTGESIPVDKAAGDPVSAGTVIRSGYLVCEATKTGEDTALSQIIRLVGDAAATKAPIAKTADRVAAVFVPAVLGVAFLTVTVWLLLGAAFSDALARGVSVLVISCPCALGLATPVAITVASGVGAKYGILYKTAAAIEETGRIKTVVLDKTGTVTAGTPQVTDIIPAGGVSADALLADAAALEQHSEHPLARAVMAYVQARGITPEPVTDFAVQTGAGISTKRGGVRLLACSTESARQHCDIPQAMLDTAENLANAGKTPIWFLRGDRLTGMIAAADTLHSDSAAAIARLKEMGLSVLMLTGDNERTAAAIGSEAGLDRVIAGVRPDGKEQVVRELSEAGGVLMVGDGINDAPALTRAAVGMAIGTGTDIAIDAADVVLMQPSLFGVCNAAALSRAALRNIKQNLFWAFCYNLIGIPLAAGVLAPLGLTLHPMFGAAAMSLSSFCVVMNALRLNLFRAIPSAQPADAHIIQQIGENMQMKATLEIKGMMCPHCEAHVRKALEGMAGVTVESVSHETGTAVVTTAGNPDAEAFRGVIADAGYEMTGFSADR